MTLESTSIKTHELGAINQQPSQEDVKLLAHRRKSKNLLMKHSSSVHSNDETFKEGVKLVDLLSDNGNFGLGNYREGS